MTKKESRAAERQQAIERLRELAPAGSTIHSIVRSVSRSGMSRTIDFYVVRTQDGDGKPWHAYLTPLFAEVGDYRQDRHGALKVGGCGMDMCFSVVYNVASDVWRDTPEAAKHAEEHPRGGASPGYVWRSETL